MFLEVSIVEMEKRQKAVSIRPNVPIGGHPVETGDYLIDTIAINEIAESIVNWIQLRVPGGIVYGAPRLGKTRAIKYIKNVLRFGSLDFRVSKVMVMLIICGLPALINRAT